MTKKALIKCITPQKLSKENFAVFGDVIEVDQQSDHFSINDGFTERYNDLAKIDVTAREGRILVNIFRATPLPQPIAIKKMERHPLSSQSFIPMGEQPYLVVVAPAGEFNSSEVEIFIATAEQGVNYYPGTWHHYCLALNNVSDFLVIDRGGDGTNCDISLLDGSIIVGDELC